MDRLSWILLLSLCFISQVQSSSAPSSSWNSGSGSGLVPKSVSETTANAVSTAESDPQREPESLLAGEIPERTWGEWSVQQNVRNVLLPIILFLGFQFLVLELKFPGIGLFGFLAFCSFGLYLWLCALSGTANWFEIILFLTGAILIFMEFMVLPGFGICGLTGMAAVLIALMLANQDFLIPSSPAEWSVFRHTLIIFLIASVGLIVSGKLIFNSIAAHYVPKDDSFIAEREKIVDYSSLVGKSGVSISSLVPAGKGLIEGQWFHVVAEGNFLEQNRPFVVVSVEGNRIIVRPE